MSFAVKTEGLGKKYLIGHQRQERYETLRDMLAHKARGLGQRLRHPLSPNAEQIELEELWALRGVDLEIQQGEKVGIIGRNGAGKTTLLKLLSRITEPSEGKFTINGRVSSLLEVGTGFHPELTGRENIFLNGAILGMSRAEIRSRFDEIVDFAEVERFLDTPVKRYSSGMYVRLAFAVAAHLEPEILIVDEVLAVGDAAFQKKCLGKMKEVGEDGRTVLLVSHNMGAISKICSRCALLHNGRLITDGDTQKAISDYFGLGTPPATGQRSWEDEAIEDGCAARLLSVQCINEQDLITNQFLSSESIRIHIELEVLKENVEISVALRLLTAERETLIHSANISDENILVTPGRWRTSCSVPAGLLNPGCYTLSVGADLPFREILFFVPDAVSFTVESGGGKWARYPSDAWRGMLGPGAVTWTSWDSC